MPPRLYRLTDTRPTRSRESGGGGDLVFGSPPVNFHNRQHSGTKVIVALATHSRDPSADPPEESSKSCLSACLPPMMRLESGSGVTQKVADGLTGKSDRLLGGMTGRRCSGAARHTKMRGGGAHAAQRPARAQLRIVPALAGGSLLTGDTRITTSRDDRGTA